MFHWNAARASVKGYIARTAYIACEHAKLWDGVIKVFNMVKGLDRADKERNYFFLEEPRSRREEEKINSLLKFIYLFVTSSFTLTL